MKCNLTYSHQQRYGYGVCVAVNFFLQLNFIFPLFLGMVMYDNEFKTKEK